MINNLYGTVVAKKLQEELAVSLSGKDLTIAAISVGDDYGTKAYFRQIARFCEVFGIEFRDLNFPDDCQAEDLEKCIKKLNQEEEVSGIILQRPLPSRFDSLSLSRAVAPGKDIDGGHPENLGLLLSGKPRVIPATALAVMELLKYYDIDTKGKDVTIVGRSLAVGKPLAVLMTDTSATVTLCHSQTKELWQQCQKADIMVAAIGKAEFFGKECFKKDAIVIDVGINEKDGRICGDVDYAAVAEQVQAITPVPKGVGSLTTVLLFANLAKLIEEK